MKKLTKLLICTLICLMTFSIMASAQNINVTINGQLQEYSTPLVSIDNRILAPVRAIFEELGATVRWDGATRTVFAYKENTVITIPIDSKIVTIQDEKSKKEIKLDVPAQIVNSSTYVPVRFVGEALGANVKWDGTTSTVIINYEIKRQKKRIDYDNGSYYEGEVVDGTLDGYGVLYYINGDKYEGYWKNDLMNGQGTYTWKDGSYYVGTWKDGKYLVGTVTNVDGTTVEYDYSDKDSKDVTAKEAIDLSNNQLAESYIKILKPLVEQMTNQGVAIPVETETVLKDNAEGFFGTNREALENLAIEAPQSQMIKNITDYNGTIINEKHRVITDEITEIPLENGETMTVAIVHSGDYVDEWTSKVLGEYVYVDRFNYMIFYVGENDVVQGSEVTFTGIPIGKTSIEIGYQTQPLVVVLAGDFRKYNYLEDLYNKQQGDGELSDGVKDLLNKHKEKMNINYKIED